MAQRIVVDGFTIVDGWYVKDNYAKLIETIAKVDAVKANQLFRKVRMKEVVYRKVETIAKSSRLETIAKDREMIRRIGMKPETIAKPQWMGKYRRD